MMNHKSSIHSKDSERAAQKWTISRMLVTPTGECDKATDWNLMIHKIGVKCIFQVKGLINWFI